MTAGLDLEGFYVATIERINAQGGDKSRLGMGALMYTSHAERPLSPDELCHALAIELDSTHFNAGNIPSVSTLVSCCQGLISVDKDVFGPRVRLIHFTLKEYFSTHPNIFSRPHSAMAEICLTYLNSYQVKPLLTLSALHSRKTRRSVARPRVKSYFDTYALDHYPFLKYCAINWGVHAKRELSDRSRSLALELLQGGGGHKFAQFILRQDRSLQLRRDDTLSPFSGLHCASFLGIAKIVVALIDMGDCDANGEDFQGCTPLAWAARKGYEEVVIILLGREEVDPDKPDNSGRTPLSYAAEYGSEGTVKILLGREEVKPNNPDYSGRTPLSYAATREDEGVAKILLGQEEVNPEELDNLGRAPLSHAAERGASGGDENTTSARGQPRPIR